MCDGKKSDFLLVLVDLSVALMVAVGAATIAFQAWIHFLRPVRHMPTVFPFLFLT